MKSSATNHSDEQPPMAIAIMVGCTAGHINTGIAIAQHFLEVVDDLSIIFVTEPSETTNNQLRNSKWHVESLISAQWMRTGLTGKLVALWYLFKGIFRAKTILRYHDVQLVIGCGGFSSVAMAFAAYRQSIPCVIHEANVIPGRANRLLARFCDQIYIGWPEALDYFPKEKVYLTGIPLREEYNLRCLTQSSQHNDSLITILITGGSMGAPFINEYVPNIMGQLASLGLKFKIKHQTGNLNCTSVIKEYHRLGLEAEVFPFVDNMSEAYMNTQFVVCSAGAITLAELAAFGLPCLIIPLKEASDDHQTANAEAYLTKYKLLTAEKQEIASIDFVSCLSPLSNNIEHVAQNIFNVLKSSDKNAAYAEVAHNMFPPDAAKFIVADGLKHMTNYRNR